MGMRHRNIKQVAEVHDAAYGGLVTMRLDRQKGSSETDASWSKMRSFDGNSLTARLSKAAKWKVYE
jgi:hypothetical protein